MAAFLSGHVSGVLSKDAPRRRDSSVVDNLRIVKGELDEICIDALSYLYILHFGELSSLLTVKTLTGMTTDVLWLVSLTQRLSRCPWTMVRPSRRRAPFGLQGGLIPLLHSLGRQAGDAGAHHGESSTEGLQQFWRFSGTR